MFKIEKVDEELKKMVSENQIFSDVIKILRSVK